MVALEEIIHLEKISKHEPLAAIIRKCPGLLRRNKEKAPNNHRAEMRIGQSGPADPKMQALAAFGIPDYISYGTVPPKRSIS